MVAPENPMVRVSPTCEYESYASPKAPRIAASASVLMPVGKGAPFCELAWAGSGEGVWSGSTWLRAAVLLSLQHAAAKRLPARPLRSPRTLTRVAVCCAATLRPKKSRSQRRSDGRAALSAARSVTSSSRRAIRNRSGPTTFASSASTRCRAPAATCATSSRPPPSCAARAWARVPRRRWRRRSRGCCATASGCSAR